MSSKMIRRRIAEMLRVQGVKRQVTGACDGEAETLLKVKKSYT